MNKNERDNKAFMHNKLAVQNKKTIHTHQKNLLSGFLWLPAKPFIQNVRILAGILLYIAKQKSLLYEIGPLSLTSYLQDTS